MKKILLIFVIALLITLVACSNNQDTQDDENLVGTLIETEEFVVDNFSQSQLENNRPIVYLYRMIIGYEDKEQTKPIYSMVASALVYEVGDEFTVATIDLGDFSYRVIMFEDRTLDTSWHTYVDKI